jgi:hypothetical protein
MKDKAFRCLFLLALNGNKRHQYRKTTSAIKVFPASGLRITVYDRKQASIKKDYNNSSLFLYIKLPKPNA